MIDCEQLLLTELGVLFPLTSIDDRKKMKRGIFPWDSFRHIELILHLEKRFQIEIPVEGALRAEDFQTLLDVVRDRLETLNHKTK